MTPYTLTTFTPAEVEKITGLTTTMQRDWRRRGFLPSNSGHARFDAFGLAEALVMKLLADRGIGPTLTKEIAHWCGVGIIWLILKDVDAYEGDHLRVFEWLPEDQRPASRSTGEDIDEEVRKLAEAAGIDVGLMGGSWGPKGSWLARQILRLRGCGGVVPARHFIWWADGSHVWHVDLNKAFDGFSWDPRLSGPVIVLDLGALASLMMERAGRAFVHVEFETGEDGELLQPLEFGAVVPLEQLRSAPSSSSSESEPRDGGAND